MNDTCSAKTSLLYLVSQLQMKNDFKKMEDEMDHLATNMASITEFSGHISDTLQDRRQQITKLSGVHMLLKKVSTRSKQLKYLLLSDIFLSRALAGSMSGRYFDFVAAVPV